MNTAQTVVALITGANRGLGYATAQRLGELGATALVGARTAKKAQDGVTELRAAGVWAHPVTLDVLINNAGVLPEAFAPEAAQPLDLRLFETAFATNVLGRSPSPTPSCHFWSGPKQAAS